jgi:hypothetical protein
MKKDSRACVPKRSDIDLWQVQSGNHTEEVNLDKRSCSCRKWDLTGMPCNHAVSAIYQAGMHPEDFVSDFFKKPMYVASYRPIFYPMPAQHGWTKTDTPDIMPPKFKDHMLGRRQEKRRKGKTEVPKPKDTSRMGTITCSNCKLQGHKYTSCTQPLKPDLAIRKNNHKVIYENLYLCAINSISTAFLILSIYNEMLQPSRTMPPPGSTVPSASAPSASAPSASAPSATAPSASAPSASTASASAPSASTAPPAPRSSATRPPTAPAAPRSSATRPPTAPPGPRSSAQGRGQGVYSYFTAGANASAGREPGVGPLGNSYAGPSCSPDDC